MVLKITIRPRRPRDERGAVALMVGAMTIMLFLIAALVVDLGLARDTKRQSQNGVDAAALAAGNALYPDGGTCTTTNTVVSKACLNDAVAEAKAYAQVNFGVTSWTGCAAAPSGYYVLTGAPSCISFDQQDRPSKVRVVMPTRDVDTSFGGVTGVQNIPVSTAARASLEPGQLIECSLCVLGSTMHNIGNGDLAVISVSGGGGIHINGSLNGHNNSNVDAGLGGSITIEGTFGGSDFDPEPTNGPRIDDPFADKTYPSYTGLPAKSNPCGASGGTGVYGSYNVGSNDTCTMLPGLYVFTGTLSLQATNSTLLGTGVTLLFTCKTGSTARACNPPGEAGGIFDAKNGKVVLTGSDYRMPGMVVAYDRNNTSAIYLQGNGLSVLTGNVYAPNSLLDANGTSCHTVVGGAIIVEDIYMNGNNNCLNVTNGVPAVYELPPSDLHLDQ